MARESRRLLILVVLALLAGASDAQARRGKAGKAKGRAAAAAGEAPAAKAAPENLPPIYLPGYDKASAQKQQGKQKPASPTPVGPRPKAAGQKPAAARPTDPMTEADRITAAAAHLSAEEEARAQLLRGHFLVCDLDGNGWISLREAEITLSMDRVEYKRLDKNQDGRIDTGEFLAQEGLILTRLGALPTSTAPATKGRPKAAETEEPTPPLGVVALASDSALAVEPAPGAEETRAKRGLAASHSELGSLRVKPGDILKRYDADKSKGIDVTEIQRLFNDLGIELSADLVIAQMDPNDSGQLEANELIAVAWMASQHAPERKDAAARLDAQGPDASEDEEADPSSDIENPGNATEFTHFARLDANQDGYIDEADLRTLQSPARLDLRLRAILSAMDGDGDGRLSEAEFGAAMLDPAR